MLARPLMELCMGLIMVNGAHTVLLIHEKICACEGPGGVEDQPLSIAHRAPREVDLCDCRCIEAGRGVLAQHLHAITSYTASVAWGERQSSLPVVGAVSPCGLC